MPAIVHNDIKVLGDTGLLFITSSSLEVSRKLPDTDIEKYGHTPQKTIKIIFDAKWEAKMYMYRWYWDTKQRKCFTYSAGNKYYLARLIASWELRHDNFDRVIMLDDIWDYRRANLHFKISPAYTQMMAEKSLLDADTLAQRSLDAAVARIAAEEGE